MKTILKNRYFNLEERQVCKTTVDTIEAARGFDLAARIAMRFPMDNILKFINPLCKEGDKVLNVSSQTGLLGLMLAGNRPDIEVYCVEENQLLSQVAEENFMIATLSNSPAKVQFTCADINSLPIDDNAADLVLSYIPLHRADNPVGFFRECARVCKDNGTVLIFDMAREAEEGVISFVLQYVSIGVDEFMESLKGSYTLDEVKALLKEAGLSNWQVILDSLTLRISSKELPV